MKACQDCQTVRLPDTPLPYSLPSVFVESGLDTLFILSRVPIVVMNPFIPLDQSAPSEARVWPIVRWWGVLTSPNFVVFLIGSVL